MIADRLMTPHAVPTRLAPAIAGSALIALALPVFFVAGWPMKGWVLAAVLWIARTALRGAAGAASARHG